MGHVVHQSMKDFAQKPGKLPKRKTKAHLTAESEPREDRLTVGSLRTGRLLTN